MLFSYQHLNSAVFLGPERHVLKRQTPPPSYLHIRLPCKPHCITQLTPELPNTCTNREEVGTHFVLFVFVVLTERALPGKISSRLGFGGLMSSGGDAASLQQLKITGHDQ